MNNGVVKLEENKQQLVPLSLVISDHALAELKTQRESLNRFIKSHLVDSVDYGVIPGTNKPSLYKPGAEKLAKIFQLGSRIVSSEKDIDPSKGWAMFTYRVEVFHLPTGKAVAQCEGSMNSQEKRNSKPMPTQINSLQKMAQKRAFVGAVIIATGASDFFTQDLEDMDRDDAPPPPPNAVRGEYVFDWGAEFKGKTLDEVGPMKVDELVTWAEGKNAGKRMPDYMARFLSAAKEYLTEQNDLRRM